MTLGCVIFYGGIGQQSMKIILGSRCSKEGLKKSGDYEVFIVSFRT